MVGKASLDNTKKVELSWSFPGSLQVQTICCDENLETYEENRQILPGKKGQ